MYYLKVCLLGVLEVLILSIATNSPAKCVEFATIVEKEDGEEVFAVHVLAYVVPIMIPCEDKQKYTDKI